MSIKGIKSGFAFPQKILYYALMLFLTLLALEGMARIAYYAAYGQGYGSGGGAGRYYPPTHTIVNLGFAATPATPFLKRHPLYGYIRGLPYHHLPDAMLPRPRREDTVVIALLGGSVAYGVNVDIQRLGQGSIGGSVAYGVNPYLERALSRWFAVNSQPRRLVFLNWAAGGVSQPQQTMLVANALLRGGAVDLIINLDGGNEIGKRADPTGKGPFPFFPSLWKSQVGLTAEELLLVGQIGILCREQARRAAVQETSILRRLALFGLTNRWRRVPVPRSGRKSPGGAKEFRQRRPPWSGGGRASANPSGGWRSGGRRGTRLAKRGVFSGEGVFSPAACRGKSSHSQSWVAFDRVFRAEWRRGGNLEWDQGFMAAAAASGIPPSVRRSLLYPGPRGCRRWRWPGAMRWVRSCRAPAAGRRWWLAAGIRRSGSGLWPSRLRRGIVRSADIADLPGNGRVGGSPRGAAGGDKADGSFGGSVEFCWRGESSSNSWRTNKWLRVSHLFVVPAAYGF